MKLLNWLPCAGPPQVKDAECYETQATDPACKHDPSKKASLSSCFKQGSSPDSIMIEEKAVGNSSLSSSAVAYGHHSSHCPLLACAIFQVLSPQMQSFLRHLNDPMLATLMELGVDIPSNWTPVDDCTVGHDGNNASGARLCLGLASFCRSEDSTQTTATSYHHHTSGVKLIQALMELSPGLKNGIESQARGMASRATSEGRWPAVGELEQCEHLVKGSHSFLVSSCYFRDKATGSLQPSILIEISPQLLVEQSRQFPAVPPVITRASLRRSSQRVRGETNRTEIEEHLHPELTLVTDNSDDSAQHFATPDPSFTESCSDGPSIDHTTTECLSAACHLGDPFSISSYDGLKNILDALPMMATMMDASGTTVLYKNKEARQYWDAVGRTPTAGMEARDPATPVTAKVMMSLLFEEELGTVCDTIAKGQTWKGVLAVPQPDHECGSTPSDSASLPSMDIDTIRPGRLVNSSDSLPTKPTSESATQVLHPPVCLEDRVVYPMPGATDGCESLEIHNSDPGNLSSRWSSPHLSSFQRHKIPPTIDEAIPTPLSFLTTLKQPCPSSYSTVSTILENDSPRGQSSEPNQSQPHRQRLINTSHSTELVKVPKYDVRRSAKSMFSIPRLADYCESVAMGCISSLVHPRGIMASASVPGTGGGLEETGEQASRSTALLSTDTLTDASTGLNVSSRLMSTKRPSNDQQSIANVDSPSSSSHLSRIVSQPGGSPCGSGPVCLTAASMKTVGRSSTSNALEFSARHAGRRSHSVGGSVPQVASIVDQDISVRGDVASSAVPAGGSTRPRFPTDSHPDFESLGRRVYPRKIRASQSFSEKGGVLELGRQGRRPAASSSTDTLSDASIGLRVSSRLMSIMRPSIDQQSTGSMDCPSPSTPLPRTVSHLGGNPCGRGSLCLPVTKSATFGSIVLPIHPGRRFSSSLPKNAVKRRVTLGDIASQRSAYWAGSNVILEAASTDGQDTSVCSGLASSAAHPGMNIEPRSLLTVDDHDISLRWGLVSSAAHPGMNIEPRSLTTVDDHDISLRGGLASSAVLPGMEIDPCFPTDGHPDFECAKSLVHPRGISGAQSFSGTRGELEKKKQAMRSRASSSSHANSDASTGLQVSSHLMSIKRPSNDQESFGSVYSPSSSTQLPQAVSHLGGSPCGTASLPSSDASIQTVTKSATISAVAVHTQVPSRLLPIMHPALSSRLSVDSLWAELPKAVTVRSIRRSVGSGGSPVSSTRLTQTLSQPCRSSRGSGLSGSMQSIRWSATTNETASPAVQSGRETPTGVRTGGQPGREPPIGFRAGGQPDLEAERRTQCEIYSRLSRFKSARASTSALWQSSALWHSDKERKLADGAFSVGDKPDVMPWQSESLVCAGPGEVQMWNVKDLLGQTENDEVAEAEAKATEHEVVAEAEAKASEIQVADEEKKCIGEEMAAEEEEEEFYKPAHVESSDKDTCWHDVTVLPVCVPHLCEKGMLLLQTDISKRTEIDMQLSAVTEAQLDMLESMLPRHVLESVVTGHSSTYDLTQLARSHSNVTIMFMDVVGFTAMSREVSSQAVMGYLNELFTWMDDLVGEYGIYKVDTCGDCYIVAGGLMKADEHGINCLVEEADYVEGARQVMRFTEELMHSVPCLPYPHTMKPTAVRVGIHTGSCVSGLIGTKLCKFSLWGDTMNTASRMESTSKPGFVQISEATMALLESSQQEKFVPCGGVEVKGRGLMQSYLWDCDHLVHDQSVEPYMPTMDDSTGSYHTQATLPHGQATVPHSHATLHSSDKQCVDKHTTSYLPWLAGCWLFFAWLFAWLRNHCGAPTRAPQSAANADLCHSVTDKLFDGPGNNSNDWDGAAPPNNIAPMGPSGLNPPNNIARMGSSGLEPPNSTAPMGSSGLEPPNKIARMGSSGLDPAERLSPFASARSGKSSPNVGSFARWLQAYNLSQKQLDKGQRVKHQAGGDRKPRISGS
eukprot:gene19967-26677_t